MGELRKDETLKLYESLGGGADSKRPVLHFFKRLGIKECHRVEIENIRFCYEEELTDLRSEILQNWFEFYSPVTLN